jgi:hypothetical protein
MAAVALAFSVWLSPLLSAQAPAAPAQAGPLPRTTDGKPNLSGIWQVMNTAAWDIQDHSAQKGIPAGQGVVEGNEIPYQPAAAAKKKENFANRATADLENRCFLPGVPRLTYMPFPFQIFQTPTYTAFVYEYVHAVRHVFTNGTPHPRGPIEWWLGDSRGRWEGDTLVVDVVHFTDQTWFDASGNHHSTALKVVERYTRTGPDVMQYEATMTDPQTFSRPWTIRMDLHRNTDQYPTLLEYECHSYFEDDAIRLGSR